MIRKLAGKIPIDKKDHIIAGVIIGFPMVMLFGYVGGLLGIGIVGAKEVVWDWLMKRGTPELWDFIASAIPIILMMILKLF